MEKGAAKEDHIRKQIENMVNFIISEAEEKKEEIKQKAKEEFTMEKAKIIQDERMKIMKEYERREKEKEVEKKIMVSNQLNQARLRVLKSRDDIIQQLREDTKRRLADVSKPGEGYKELLAKLIVQAALKMREPSLKVRCREADKAMVKDVIGKATEEYKRRTGDNISLEIDTENTLPPAPAPDADLSYTHRYCSGGIVLSAKEGRILCNNTLDQRLNLAFDAKIPEMRKKLFGKA